MAHITVISKLRKDPSVCFSYRPISLLNLNIKLLSKIIAMRLCRHLPDIIGLEQVGFMPGREAHDNVIKAINLIHTLKGHTDKGLLLSTDAEKAFYRVAWDFMFAVCRHTGLQPNMLAWILALY